MNDDEKSVTPEPKPDKSGSQGSSSLLDRLKEGLNPFIDKGKKDLKAAKDYKRTQVWKSIFRHKLDETPRNRALAVLTNVFLHLQPAKVNRDAVRFGFTWGMGGITLYLFIVLTITGVFLMFYYHPHQGPGLSGHHVPSQRCSLWRPAAQHAPVGSPFDDHHRLAAHVSVFLTGSYKSPREFNWSVGVILLVLTLLLSFTGYLLPDDQLGFWAVTVGTNMARATPLLGHEGPFGSLLGMTAYNDVRFALLGGSIVDSNALLRAYIWHCIAIPLILSVFLAVHFWRVRKDGSISGPAPVMLESEMKFPRK